jgi:hypothetical protein
LRRAQAMAEFAIVTICFMVLISGALTLAPIIGARNQALAIATELLDRSTRYLPPDPSNRFGTKVTLANQRGPLCKSLTLAGRELMRLDNPTAPALPTLYNSLTTGWGSDPGTVWCQPLSALSAARPLTVDVTLLSGTKMTPAERVYLWTGGQPSLDANGQQRTGPGKQARYRVCVGIYWVSPSPIVYLVTNAFSGGPLLSTATADSIFKFYSCGEGTLGTYRGE